MSLFFSPTHGECSETTLTALDRSSFYPSSNSLNHTRYPRHQPKKAQLWCPLALWTQSTLIKIKVKMAVILHKVEISYHAENMVWCGFLMGTRTSGKWFLHSQMTSSSWSQKTTVLRSGWLTLSSSNSLNEPILRRFWATASSIQKGSLSACLEQRPDERDLSPKLSDLLKIFSIS